MFHNTTTLHHRRSEFSMIGRESRVVHLGWFAQKGLEARVFWRHILPLRRIGRIYSWAFGWPLIKKGAQYTMKGIHKLADAIEWSAYTIMEGTRGAVQATLEPLGSIAYSRPVAYKRTLWDTGWASLKAAFKTPFRLLTSPREVALGVRDAVASIPKNAGEMLNSIREFRLWDLVKNTRKAVTDVIFPPVTRPIKSVFEPAYEAVSTAFNAQYQTVEAIRRGAFETMPAGLRRMREAPATASAILAEKKKMRMAAKAILDQEKEAERAAREAQEKSAMGLETGGGKGGGGMKKAA